MPDINLTSPFPSVITVMSGGLDTDRHTHTYTHTYTHHTHHTQILFLPFIMSIIARGLDIGFDGPGRFLARRAPEFDNYYQNMRVDTAKNDNKAGVRIVLVMVIVAVVNVIIVT